MARNRISAKYLADVRTGTLPFEGGASVKGWVLAGIRQGPNGTGLANKRSYVPGGPMISRGSTIEINGLTKGIYTPME
jgi:hypothetical protein